MSVRAGSSSGLRFGFDATGNPAACGTCAPPDPNGDVGPNHYVHMVNATKVAIYDKSGTLLSGPFDLSTLWSSGPCTADLGNPIVVYDPMADRWLLSQLALPSHMCVAVSQGADPTGNYYTYTFDVGSFPGYPKFGVWPDGYYMSADEATYTAYAFDRASMLAGAAATFLKFTGQTNFHLPSDLDGSTLPPAGAPNVFYTFKDDAFHGGVSDRLELFEFHVNWTTPADSTFTLATTLPIAPFTYTPCGFLNLNCIRQLGTTQRFDALGEWPLFRFPYRNFGTHESLVGTFVVGGGLGEVGAAIRWFELRKAGGNWTLHQEGTHDPGDGHDRTNASIAMDGRGNIALAFTVSSSTIHPAIGYATRLSSQPLGTLQSEAIVLAPNGSQTGSNRWGDYSAMVVDPVDECTFWYTNQYYDSTSATQWRTRVSVFAIPECLPPSSTIPTSSTTTSTLTSSTTTSTLPVATGRSVRLRLMRVKPGRVVKLVAKGIPSLVEAIEPKYSGAWLSLTGTTGSAAYDLPAEAWKALRRRGALKGYRFRSATCTVVLKASILRARCKGDTGSLALPEPGPVEAVLTIGSAARYCGQCGGTPAGKPRKAFRRRRCAAPASCP